MTPGTRRGPSIRLRTVGLACLFAFSSFFVSATPTEVLPIERPEALSPQPVAALGCASEPAFTGFITNTYTTTPATISTTGLARGYISAVNATWSCTAFYRYDGLAWVRADAEEDGNFQWGTLINSTSVPCNWVLNETSYLKANNAAHCHTSDSDHGMQLELLNFTGQLQEEIWRNDTTHDDPGDFMFIHSDCTSYYEGSGMAGQRVRWNVPFGASQVLNRPGDNCDPTVLDGTGTGQTIVVDGTAPTIGFDWPAAGGPASSPGSSVWVKFDATDNLAGFSGSNDWDLQRQSTALGTTPTTCATTWTNETLVSGTTNNNDQTSLQQLSPDRCYRWTLAAKDSNGNTATTIASGTIRVEGGASLGSPTFGSFESWGLGGGDSLAVNTATGNLVLDHPIVDLPIRGGSSAVNLVYNRHDTRDVGMGPGWRLDVQRRLATNPDGTVTFTDGDGSRHTFSAPVVAGAITTYSRPASLYATLVKDTNLVANEFVLTYRDQARDKFNILSASEAILVRAEDRFGNGVSIDNAPGTSRITRVIDTATGREMTFAYDGSNRLTGITDWAVVAAGVIQASGTPNRLHRFFYDASSRLSGWAGPLNTGSSCPATPTTNIESHLSCLGYDAAGAVTTITKAQTYTTISAGTLGTATRSATTRVSSATFDVSTVKDAEEEANASAGTSFSHPTPYTTQVVRRGTLPASKDSTTSYLAAFSGDPYGRITTIERSFGIGAIRTTMAYAPAYPIEPASVIEDTAGSLARTTTTTYQPSTMGLVSRIDAPLDGISRHYTDFTYNANNDITQQIVSRGGDATDRTVTQYSYAAGSGCAGGLLLCALTERVVSGGAVDEDTNITTDYQVDPFGRRTRETRHNRSTSGAVIDDRITRFVEDDLGNLTAEVANYVDGAVTSPGDDISPNPTTNARTDLTTLHTYDTAGNRTSSAEPRRAIETARGTSLGPDDFITRFTYDARNQRLSEKTPTTPGVTISQKTATSTYDELGLVRSATDFGGVVTASLFDRAGRATETYRDTDGSGPVAATITARSGYDPSGRVLWSEDEVQALDPAGGSDPGRTDTTYDELGRATSTTEAAGSVTPAIPSTTTMTFDAHDRVIETIVGIESGAAQRTRTTYDPGDRVTSLDDEFTCTTTTSDYRGLATAIVEGKTSGSPCTGAGTRTINQTFDGMGRMTSRAVAGGETLETSTYDGAGRATKTWSALGTTSRVVETTFNILDQPVTEYRYTDTAGTRSAESWARANRDPAGNETDRCTWTAAPSEWCKQADGTFANPQPVTRSSSRYDARNNRIELYTPGLGATTYDPGANYQVAGVYLPTAAGREHQTLHTYDERHRLDTLTNVLCATNQRPCAGANILATTLADDYGYDTNDSRTQVIENNGAGATTRHYCYDARNRLVGVYSATGCSSGLLEANAYDAAGNRTSAAGRTFTYDAEGQLATCSGSACSPVFDADGRLTRIVTATGTWSYEYDGESRLVRACKAVSCATGSPDRLESTYDGEGHRVQTRTYAAGVLVSTTVFRYEGDSVTSEVATSGATVVTRTFTTDEAGAIVKLTVVTTGGGSTADDGTYLVTWNGHGDALALAEINPDGSLTPAARYTYGTWGAPTISAQPGYGDLAFRYLYVGRYDVQWDDFSGAGLLYMHARHHSPEFGRFLQPDPSALETNLYGYAGSSPITHIDPDGMIKRQLDGGGPGMSFGRFGLPDLSGKFRDVVVKVLTKAGGKPPIINGQKATAMGGRAAAERAGALLHRIVKANIVRYQIYYGKYGSVVVVHLRNGWTVAWRNGSRSGGPAIEIYAGSFRLKIHFRGPGIP